MIAGVLGALLAACGGGGSTTAVTAPPTTVATVPPSPTVPAFGSPAAVAPATPGNATTNAQGACSRFAILYVRVAQIHVSSADAAQSMAVVRQFATAAALGAPDQWGQLRTDVDALAAAVSGAAWSSAASQIGLQPVRTVSADCRPLQ